MPIPFANQQFPQGGPSFTAPQVIYNQAPQPTYGFYTSVLPGLMAAGKGIHELIAGNPYEEALTEQAKANAAAANATAEKTKNDQLDAARKAVAGADPAQQDAIRQSYYTQNPEWAEQGLLDIGKTASRQRFDKIEEMGKQSRAAGGWGDGSGPAPAQQPGQQTAPETTQQAPVSEQTAKPQPEASNPYDAALAPPQTKRDSAVPPATPPEASPAAMAAGTAGVAGSSMPAPEETKKPPVMDLVKEQQQIQQQSGRPLISLAEVYANPQKYTPADALPIPEAVALHGPQMEAMSAELESPAVRPKLNDYLAELALLSAEVDMENGRTPAWETLINVGLSETQARNVFYTAGSKAGIQHPPDLNVALDLAQVMSGSATPEVVQRVNAAIREPGSYAANAPLAKFIIDSKVEIEKVRASVLASETALEKARIAAEAQGRSDRVSRENAILRSETDIAINDADNAQRTWEHRGDWDRKDREIENEVRKIDETAANNLATRNAKRVELYQEEVKGREERVKHLETLRNEAIKIVEPNLTPEGGNRVRLAQGKSQVARDLADRLDSMRTMRISIQYELGQATDPDKKQSLQDILTRQEEDIRRATEELGKAQKESADAWTAAENSFKPGQENPRALKELQDLETQLNGAYNSLKPFKDPEYQRQFAKNLGRTFSGGPAPTPQQFALFEYGGSGQTIGDLLPPAQMQRLYQEFLRSWEQYSKAGPGWTAPGGASRRGTDMTRRAGQGTPTQAPPGTTIRRDPPMPRGAQGPRERRSRGGNK